MRYEDKVLKAYDYHKALYGYRKLFYYLKAEKGVQVSLSQAHC